MWKNIEALSSLSSLPESDQDIIYTSLLGRLGIALVFYPLDIEIINEEDVVRDLSQILSHQDTDVELKFVSKTLQKVSDFDNLSRSVSLNDPNRLQSYETINFLLIETSPSRFPLMFKNTTQRKNKLVKIATTFKNLSIELGPGGETKYKLFRSALKKEIESLFLPVSTEIVRFPDYLVIEQKLIGMVRIKTNTGQNISLCSLNSVRMRLEFEHTVTVNLKRVPSMRQEALLNHLKRESQIAIKFSDLERKQEVELLEDSIQNKDECLFEIEILFTVYATNEKALRVNLLRLSTDLMKEYGSAYIENVGAYQSFVASQIGNTLHQGFYEQSIGIPFYLPIFSNFSEIQQSKSKRTLRIHRRGAHLQSVELISNLYQSGNTLIVGPKGSGKSVLCGLITQSILNDESTQILKMDVGSSYTRECQRYGGQQFSLELNEPSGLNPLEVFLRTPHDLEICDIVADFLEVLVAKNTNMTGAQGSPVLSEEEKSDLDRVVIDYSISRPKAPNLNDFLLFSKGRLPNVGLFKRWTAGGMFENIFKPRIMQQSRYRYYDFKSVSNASNPALVRGSIAAVMAQYNSEVAISGRDGPRIFLFCDETTEFFNHCSPFFISTAKNSRKFGHATILINQESASFQVADRRGLLSNSLFENTDHHFLFSYPSDPEDIERFQARHKLTKKEYLGITKLQYQKGGFSEVFYKTRLGGQTLKIKLTPEEYWLLTSDKDDYDKIRVLTKMGFTTEDAICCLSKLS